MIFKYKTGSTDWLEARRKYVTATEMASLLGLNSYMGPKQLKEYKTNPNSIDNLFLRDGKILEPAVILAMHIDLGMHVEVPCEFGHSMMFTDEEAKVSSTPDAFYWDKKRPAVVECKSTTISNFNKHWRGDLPPVRYLTQVHVQMHTTGMRRAYLACIGKREQNLPLSVYEVDYCPTFNKLMLQQTKQFWAAYDENKALTITKKVKESAARLIKDSVKFVGIYEFRDSEQAEDFNPSDLFK